MAVRKAMEHIKDGYVWVVDLDLRKFFDTVNHSKLIQLLSERIKDGRVISLIHKFLRAQISEDGKVGKPNTIGRSRIKAYVQSAMRMMPCSLPGAEKRLSASLPGYPTS